MGDYELSLLIEKLEDLQKTKNYIEQLFNVEDMSPMTQEIISNVGSVLFDKTDSEIGIIEDKIKKIKINSSIRDQLKYISELPENEKNLLKLYTTQFYINFNQNLQDGYKLTKLQQEVYNVMLKCFSEIPPLKEPLVLYRGVKDSNTYFSENNAPVSMSLDKNIAKQFVKGKCCLYEITVLQNSKILPIYEISNIYEEMEVLALFGTFSEITEIHNQNLTVKYLVYDNINSFI